MTAEEYTGSLPGASEGGRGPVVAAVGAPAGRVTRVLASTTVSGWPTDGSRSRRTGRASSATGGTRAKRRPAGAERRGGGVEGTGSVRADRAGGWGTRRETAGGAATASAPPGGTRDGGGDGPAGAGTRPPSTPATPSGRHRIPRRTVSDTCRRAGWLSSGTPRPPAGRRAPGSIHTIYIHCTHNIHIVCIRYIQRCCNAGRAPGRPSHATSTRTAPAVAALDDVETVSTRPGRPASARRSTRSTGSDPGPATALARVLGPATPKFGSSSYHAQRGAAGGSRWFALGGAGGGADGPWWFAAGGATGAVRDRPLPAGRRAVRGRSFPAAVRRGSPPGCSAAARAAIRGGSSGREATRQEQCSPGELDDDRRRRDRTLG